MVHAAFTIGIIGNVCQATMFKETKLIQSGLRIVRCLQKLPKPAVIKITEKNELAHLGMRLFLRR